MVAPHPTTQPDPAGTSPTLPTLQSEQSRISPWLMPLAYALGRRLVLPLMFRHIDVQGLEHIPRRGPVLLAPTHRARWDALILPRTAGRPGTGRDIRFMVSANEMRGLQGWFIWRCGGFPVNTDQPGIGSVRYGVDLLASGELLVVFPEGGIFRDEQVHPLKVGPAWMAIQAASQSDHPVQVVPVGLAYSQPYPRCGSRVAVRFGPPLSTDDIAPGPEKQRARDLSRELRQRMDNLHRQALTAVGRDTPITGPGAGTGLG
jgi:1-acyl-sn-glycerol-3-phosphate acyltransferase